MTSNEQPQEILEERAQAALLALARLLGRIMAHEHLLAQPGGSQQRSHVSSAKPPRKSQTS